MYVCERGQRGSLPAERLARDMWEAVRGDPAGAALPPDPPPLNRFPLLPLLLLLLPLVLLLLLLLL